MKIVTNVINVPLSNLFWNINDLSDILQMNVLLLYQNKANLVKEVIG